MFFHKLSDLVSKDCIIYNDTGANLCWSMMSFRVKHNQRLISAYGHSPMGYSISAGLVQDMLKEKRDYFYYRRWVVHTKCSRPTIFKTSQNKFKSNSDR